MKNHNAEGIYILSNIAPYILSVLNNHRIGWYLALNSLWHNTYSPKLTQVLKFYLFISIGFPVLWCPLGPTTGTVVLGTVSVACGKTCWRTGSWGCCLSLDVVSSIPAYYNKVCLKAPMLHRGKSHTSLFFFKVFVHILHIDGQLLHSSTDLFRIVAMLLILSIWTCMLSLYNSKVSAKSSR